MTCVKKNSIRKFINHVKRECEEVNVKFIMADSEFLVAEYRTRVNGYFDEENLALVCAVKKPRSEWLPLLVHEFGHFGQHKDGCKVWENSMLRGNDTSEKMFAWIKGQSFSPKDIEKYVRLTRNVELDCERRASRLIKKFRLPINIARYIQGANAYIYFHNYVLLRRTWYKVGKEPYNIPEIVNAMPTTLYNHYERLPQKYVKLYDKYILQ